MPLNLSDEDQAEYTYQSGLIEQTKQEAIAKGDREAARRCRQRQSDLYHRFKQREIQPREHRVFVHELTLEERIERIEVHLGIDGWIDRRD